MLRHQKCLEVSDPPISYFAHGICGTAELQISPALSARTRLKSILVSGLFINIKKKSRSCKRVLTETQKFNFYRLLVFTLLVLNRGKWRSRILVIKKKGGGGDKSN